MAKGGSGDRGDGGGCVVYRYSHGRVFAAIFGPFPFAARGAFTVHTSYRPRSSTSASHPRSTPPPPSVMDTQGVVDYANEASRPSTGPRWTVGNESLLVDFYSSPSPPTFVIDPSELSYSGDRRASGELEGVKVDRWKILRILPRAYTYFFQASRCVGIGIVYFTIVDK